MLQQAVEQVLGRLISDERFRLLAVASLESDSLDLKGMSELVNRLNPPSLLTSVWEQK